MTQETLLHVLAEIETLEPDELCKVERVIRVRMQKSSKEIEREAVLRVLGESGLVKAIKRPPMDVSRERPLVPIEGKPLSETIIEERR